MTPTEMRAARESGIALGIECSFPRKSSTAILDARHRKKFHRPRGDSSGAILSIDGNDAGSEPNCGTKTAGQAGPPGPDYQCRTTNRGAGRVAQRNRSEALRRNFLQPTGLVRSFWKPRRDSGRSGDRGFPGLGTGYGAGPEAGKAWEYGRISRDRISGVRRSFTRTL